MHANDFFLVLFFVSVLGMKLLRLGAGETLSGDRILGLGGSGLPDVNGVVVTHS